MISDKDYNDFKNTDFEKDQEDKTCRHFTMKEMAQIIQKMQEKIEKLEQENLELRGI